MPRHQGKLRKQVFVQCTTSEPQTEVSTGSEADLESLSTMNSFFDARESTASAVTEPNEFVSSPLIRNTSENMQTSPDEESSPIKKSNGQSREAPTINHPADATGRTNIELDHVSNGAARPRLSPARSKSTDVQPSGSFFSDGLRNIDYVLAFDLDQIEDDEEQSDDEQKDLPSTARSIAQQSAAEKRRIFENNLQTMGLELEHVYAKYTRIAFVLIHAPFKVLMKQAELLKIKMPVYQNDVKKVANLMDGLVNGFLQRFKWLDFDETVRSRIEPSDYFCQPFIEQHLECFVGHDDEQQFFSRCQRSRMVYDILIRTRYDQNETAEKLRFGIDRLVKSRTYLDAYPLHEDLEENVEYDPKTCSERRLLYENWVKPRNVWKYQPLHTIKNYFGTKIGFYFAWIGYYTRSLYAISVIGVFCFIFGLINVSRDIPSQQICDADGIGGNTLVCPICDKYCDFTKLSETCVYAQLTYVFDNGLTVFYAAAMSLWATLFLEGWKRYHAELAYKWNVFDFEAEDEVPRPEFQFRRKHMKVNPVTLNNEPYVPSMEKSARVVFSAISVLFFICMVIALILGITVYRLIVLAVMYQQYYDHDDTHFQTQAVIMTSTSAAVINLCIILVFNQIYNNLALKLTEMECPRTQTEFDNSYTFKVFAFQFVNFYASLFYIAFLKPRWTQPKKDTIFGYRLEQCDTSGCMVELVVQMAVIMIGKQFVNAFAETCMPIVYNAFRRWRLRLPESKTQRQERIRQESHVEIEAAPEGVSLVEKDYSLNSVTDQFLFDEYLEMVIQFGFCTLFVAAFPLAPLCALLNNIVEIRLDAYKFVVAQRKPQPLPARNIGIWFTILDLLSKLSVLCNACVIAFTSDFVPRTLYYFLHRWSLDGYLESSMSYYDARNMTVLNSQYNKTEVCRFRDFRRFPCSLNGTSYDVFQSESNLLGHFDQFGDECDQEYSYSYRWWILLAFRLMFILLFEHLVLFIKGVVAYLIPDVPNKIVVQLQRERYLARQAVLQRADENSTTVNSSYRDRAQSGGETTDTEAVAYQPGVDALEGQDLAPSNELRRMYSNRKRPSLSSRNSNVHSDSATHTISVNDSSPNLSVRPNRFRVPSDGSLPASYESFRTAPGTPKPTSSLPKMS